MKDCVKGGNYLKRERNGGGGTSVIKNVLINIYCQVTAQIKIPFLSHKPDFFILGHSSLLNEFDFSIVIRNCYT